MMILDFKIQTSKGKSTFNSCAEGRGASAGTASGSVDRFNDMFARPSVIATIMMRPTSPLFSAFSPTLTAYACIRTKELETGTCHCLNKQ